MDVLGRYKCWHVRDKSPAHLVWEAVSKTIIELLEDQHEHLSAGDSSLGVGIFMIGRKPTSANPTVLFSCENKPPRQKAMEIVQKRGILAPYPGVLTAESSRVPQLLARGNDADAPSYEPTIYRNGPLVSCGTGFVVRAIDGGSWRKAAIGGTVCIENEYYGLTTAHPFLETGNQSRNKNARDDPDFAFYELDEPDGGSSNEEDSVEMTSMGEICAMKVSVEAKSALGSISSNSSISQVAPISGGSDLSPPSMSEALKISERYFSEGDDAYISTFAGLPFRVVADQAKM
jgi:hypothetical protein